MKLKIGLNDFINFCKKLLLKPQDFFSANLK